MATDPFVAAQLVIYRAALDHLAAAGAAETADVNHIINSARIDVLRFQSEEQDLRLEKGAEVLSTLRSSGAEDVARTAELAHLAGAALDEALDTAEVALGRKVLKLDRALSAFAGRNVPGHLPESARREALFSLASEDDVDEAQIAATLGGAGVRLIGRLEPSVEI